MIMEKNGGWCVRLAILMMGAWLGPFGISLAVAEDRLLQEVVEFTGTIVFLEHRVPGLVIGAVRNGERTVAGFGETRNGGDPREDAAGRHDGAAFEPDGAAAGAVAHLWSYGLKWSNLRRSRG